MFQTKNGITYGFDVEMRYDPAQKRTLKRLVLLIPGQGCVPWLRSKAKCCPFCRLPAGTRLAVLGEGHEDHFEPWTITQEDYFEMIDHAFTDADGVEKVVCFNGGSFLTDREIPREVRQHLYAKVADHPTAKALMVESRPEFVRADMLNEAEAYLQGKELTIAIGLESTNDRIRNGPLAKFIGRKSFETALSLLQERGHRVFTYVFVGAPTLTQIEAYQDAANSVRDLHAMGVDEIALSCAFVPPGGQLEQWYREGTFRPPQLWTIAQLLSQAKAQDWPVSLGGFDDFPPPIARPQNCGKCDDAVHAQFDQFRMNNQFDMAKLPQCGCYTSWSRDIGDYLKNAPHQTSSDIAHVAGI